MGWSSHKKVERKKVCPDPDFTICLAWKIPGVRRKTLSDSGR